MTWTDARIDQLKQLWADGLSTSQIAGELGGLTRSAVLGKLHRLGLSGRAKTRSPRARVPRQRKRRSAAVFGPRGQALALTAALEAAEPEAFDNVIPFGQRRTLLELGADTCRWPIGDPACAEFFFCGGKPAAGLPYCSHHSRVAFRPTARREAPVALRRLGPRSGFAFVGGGGRRAA